MIGAPEDSNSNGESAGSVLLYPMLPDSVFHSDFEIEYQYELN